MQLIKQHLASISNRNRKSVIPAILGQAMINACHHHAGAATQLTRGRPLDGLRSTMHIVFDHEKRKPRAGSERAPHLSLDTAVRPLTSAPIPRRADGGWVLALSPRERARLLTSASWVQTKMRVNISARLTRAGLMPATLSREECAAGEIVAITNLPDASGGRAWQGDCTI
jgi:hypothetical protein